MSDTRLVDANGNEVSSRPMAPAPPADCEECGTPAERFSAVLGGSEVCMNCGHKRRQQGLPGG